MEVNNVAVMRRRADSWLNATQILKVAGVDKGKRTKILEKEIQTGEHEKVQGGYGKYQGTWIKFDRGVEVCQQYGVEELLRPLLTYDMGQDGGVAGRGDISTPTKEQAMAAQRKRTMYASQEAKQGSVASTFFKSISTTASQAVAAISKARFDSPGPRGKAASAHAAPRPSFSRQSSMQTVDDIPPNSQQSIVSDYNSNNNADSQFGPSSQTAGGGPGSSSLDEPPRKRLRIGTPAGSFAYGAGGESYGSAVFPPPSPTEANDSFYQPAPAMGGDHVVVAPGQPVPPIQFEMSPEAESARQQMVYLFIGPDTIPDDVLGKLSPAQIDMPIDALCNNSLHYAATLARVKILATLVGLGGNVWRVNADGDTPLMRAVMVTNSLDGATFPELLEILGCTLDARDNKGRTVLHKIALASGLKGRATSSKYYLESLLEWVVRSGSAPSSQMATTTTTTTMMPTSSQRSQAMQSGNMSLARFLHEIVDAQDDGGDTALMIAARIGNKSIISQLLEVGADPTIANRVGLKPTTFGVGIPNERTTDGLGDATRDGGDNNSNDLVTSRRARETNEEILTFFTSVLKEGTIASQRELAAKQESLNEVHARLAAANARLAEERRQLEGLQAKLRQQRLDRQRIANFTQAIQSLQDSLPSPPAAAAAAAAAEGTEAATTATATTADLSTPDGPRDAHPLTTWETELRAAIEAADAGSSPTSVAAMLPPTAVLRARHRAVAARTEELQRLTAALRARSRDKEDKYRRLVALCAQIKESEVDGELDGLLKAVESEGGELEIGRVRRFLGSLDVVP